MDEAWYRCSLCGTICEEDELLQDEDGDPVACPACGSLWIDSYCDDDEWSEAEAEEE